MAHNMDRRPPAGLNLGLSFNHGKAYDASTYRHAPSMEANTTYTDSLAMTGSGYVRYSDDPAFDFSTEMTVAFWLKTSSTRINYLISKWEAPSGSDSFLIYLTSAGKIYFNTSTSGSYQSSRDLVGTVTARDGSWHHVACTYGGGSSKVYVDGELDSSKSLSGTIHNSSTNFAIGSLGLGTNSGFNLDGSIDDLRLYSRALPATGIAKISQEGRP